MPKDDVIVKGADAGHSLRENKEYIEALDSIKRRIRAAQYKAILGANVEMHMLYWNIGKVIIDNTRYGAKFVDNLSYDILTEFPQAKGYSVRNLKYMRKFAEVYSDPEKVQRTVALLPWRNNITLMSKINDADIRDWYIKKNIENSWNDTILTHQIETDLHGRQGVAEKVSNFKRTLPSPQSELAIETMKDPYLIDFVDIDEKIAEREIEKELVENISKLLLELGSGFAFVGNQYHIEVGEQDFYIDMLFYHLKLRCYVVVELKTTSFKPEYAGQLNFYLSAVDDLLRKEEDGISIGLLLCKEKNNIIAEYALRNIQRPIGVSEYRLVGKLPSELEGALPSVEDIEERINARYKVKSK